MQAASADRRANVVFTWPSFYKDQSRMTLVIECYYLVKKVCFTLRMSSVNCIYFSMFPCIWLKYVWEQDVSAEGFPVPCLPIGTSPLRTTVTASEDSEAAETSRGAFSVMSRQDFPLKRKLSDAMGAHPFPELSRYRSLTIIWQNAGAQESFKH